MFIFASFCLIFGAEGKIHKFRRLHCSCEISQLALLQVGLFVHCSLFCLYIYIKFIILKILKNIYIFHTNANFRIGAKFSHSTVAPFYFAHNFFMQTLSWVILVLLESLESVESKYSKKEHF